ncbi:MAG TPA: response regulator [Xanthomonadaceae bacterium]|nr:response regulator [Xanthomonadaceae bacterium]
MAAPLMAAPGNQVNILLVDDQPSRLLSYEAILAELGERLVTASSGTEALARLMEAEYAVILLDVNMPGMDGFETAELIHQHPHYGNTPIIFVTGVHISDLDRVRGYKLGAVDYVSVPVMPEILRSKVAVLAELFRKRRELERVNRSLEETNAELARAHQALEAEREREVHGLNQTLARANETLTAEIAERRRFEEELKEAGRRKDRFLATLAHELRNPLAPIRSALQAMQLAREHDRPYPEHAERMMERQLSLLVRLIDDLLDVSRITSDKLELRMEPTSLETVIDAAIETARPLIEASGHRLEVELNDSTSVPLEADPYRLAQVFANLLNNACKYTDPGGSIRVTARREGDEVAIAVRDSGIGLEPTALTEIFEPFVQVDHSLECTRGGLGIGLTLVKRLVEHHGGKVAAASAGPGRGSEFEVRLPVAPAPATTPGDPQSPAATEHDPARTGTGAIVSLVVDDNRDAADMLGWALRMLGHSVTVCYNPEDVLERVETLRPAILFIDVGMPRLNGYDLTRRLRQLPSCRDAVIVALTGWGQEEDRRQSREAGFDHHLVKPADVAEIGRICAALAERDGGHDAGPGAIGETA